MLIVQTNGRLLVLFRCTQRDKSIRTQPMPTTLPMSHIQNYQQQNVFFFWRKFTRTLCNCIEYNRMLHVRVVKSSVYWACNAVVCLQNMRNHETLWDWPFTMKPCEIRHSEYLVQNSEESSEYWACNTIVCFQNMCNHETLWDWLLRSCFQNRADIFINKDWSRGGEEGARGPRFFCVQPGTV